MWWIYEVLYHGDPVLVFSLGSVVMIYGFFETVRASLPWVSR